MRKPQQFSHGQFLETSKLNQLIKMGRPSPDNIPAEFDVLYNLKKEKRYSTQSQTPLHFAVRTHNPKVLKALLEKVTQYDESLFVSLHKLCINSSSDKRSEITGILNEKEIDLTGSKIAKATAIAVAKVEFEVDVEFETNLHDAIRANNFEALTNLLKKVIQYDESLFVSLHELNLKFNTKTSSDKSLTAIGNKITAALNEREVEFTGLQRAETKAKLYSAIHADNPKVLASLLEEITQYDKSLFVSLHELNLKLEIKASSDKSLTAVGNKITAVLNKRETEFKGSEMAEAEAKTTAKLYSAIQAGDSKVLANLLKQVITYDENLFKSLYRLSINAPENTKDEIIATLIRRETELPSSPKYIEPQARALPLPNSKVYQEEEKIEKDGKKSDRPEQVTVGGRKVKVQSAPKNSAEFSLELFLLDKQEKISAEIESNEYSSSKIISEKKEHLNKRNTHLSKKDEHSDQISRFGRWKKIKDNFNYHIGYRWGWTSLRYEIEKCDKIIDTCNSSIGKCNSDIEKCQAILSTLEEERMSITTRLQKLKATASRKQEEKGEGFFEKSSSSSKELQPSQPKPEPKPTESRWATTAVCSFFSNLSSRLWSANANNNQIVPRQ